ncbi:MAG: ABC transporter permease [Rhodobacteraceae bacterium]|nr:ABC transporter permease [Paracoccaceae bacterium]
MTGALRAEGRVLGALVLRETRAAFGQARLGYLWALIGPVLGTALLAGLFAVAGRHPPFGQSFALFFATCLLPVDFVTRMSLGLMQSVAVSRPLFGFRQVRPFDVLLARFLLLSATHSLAFLIVFGGLISMGLADWPTWPERVLAAWTATAALGLGLGMVNACLAAHWPGWAQVAAILFRPLVLLSGLFYLPVLLPPDLWALLRWNPVLHLVEWLREGIYAGYLSSGTVAAFPVGLALSLILLGLLGERLSRRRLVAG